MCAADVSIHRQAAGFLKFPEDSRLTRSESVEIITKALLPKEEPASPAEF